MKIITKIRKKIKYFLAEFKYFFKFRLPFTHGWNEYHNPFYHWWKVRKYFKMPYVHFIHKKDFWCYGCYARKDLYNKYVHIRFGAVGWKDKDSGPSYEYDPMIEIVFFRKYHLVWIFNWVTKDDPDSWIKNITTWEAILDMIYYEKSLDTVVKESVCSDKERYITIENNLRR